MSGLRRISLFVALALIGSTFVLAGPASAEPVTRAGVAVVDASWHVGAAAGQYAGDPANPDEDEFDPMAFVTGSHGFDPHRHQLRRDPSYGIQSRLTIRALVVEGPDGTRVALVKNDLYIPQDILWRRTAQILEAGDSGIDREHLAIMVSHNHSSPYYSSTSWGPWLFQDSFDFRFFDYYAERMALAVERAARNLVPVRMGVSVSHFDKTHRHSFGPAIADDGTPAGYPHSDNDDDMMIVRFDDVSNPSEARPLAILANFGLHPEFLEGNNLISADYLGPLERMVDRASGAVLIWSQGSVGTGEPERSTHHSIHERLEFSHRDYAQAERGARLMADVILDTWRDVELGTPEEPDRFLPLAEGFPVAMVDRVFPGPISHPYPGVSNCRTDPTLGGGPRFPIVGLPDCESFGSLPFNPGITTDDFESAGIPVPENYSAPSYMALEETLSVHLQAIKLGDLLIAVCPCEQWADQTRNVKTRTDRVEGNIWLGFDWAAQCSDNGDGTWTCPNPRDASKTLTVGDLLFRRMRAQVNNDAAGWNDPENALFAESEPADPAEIKGNYTHTELPPARGYGMTMTIGMANDYLGYIATYREYQRGDHYRKSLTGFGAHSSDYLATRLVQMGGFLNGAAEPGDASDALLATKSPPDQASADLRARALGVVGDVAIPAYEALLPDDGGVVEITGQPEDIERFDAAFFSWIGGSNYTDDPIVKVERQTDEGWEDFADMTGEVVVTLEFPTSPDAAVPYLLGDQTWEWTAHFEAFDSDLADLGERPGSTPVGTYRFLVDGLRREGGTAVPYHLESDPFEVGHWSGITVEDIRVEPDRRVSFLVGPTSTIEVPPDPRDADQQTITATIGPIDYPDSYDSPIPFIRNQRRAFRDPAAINDPTKLEWFCFPCSFRPWADTGEAATAEVTFLNPAGNVVKVVPALLGTDGRWRTTEKLPPPFRALVARGGVVDQNGEFNGEPSATVGG